MLLSEINYINAMIIENNEALKTLNISLLFDMHENES